MSGIPQVAMYNSGPLFPSGSCLEATAAFVWPQAWLVWVPAGDGGAARSFLLLPSDSPSLGRAASLSEEETVWVPASVSH